jgi:hypothetical protein
VSGTQTDEQAFEYSAKRRAVFGNTAVRSLVRVDRTVPRIPREMIAGTAHRVKPFKAAAFRNQMPSRASAQKFGYSARRFRGSDPAATGA